MQTNNTKGEETIFNDLRKDATHKTILINNATYKKINWNRVKKERYFAKKGLIINPGLITIEGKNSGIPIWDLKQYEFLLNEEIPYTVNPMLWLQGKMNLNIGLFKVTDSIYQVRGYDLANLTLIKGFSGWIVIDCLSCEESAKAALDLASSYFDNLNISAIIITHSHVDHYGGILGVINNYVNDNTKIYVPKNYTDSVISENVTAGVAMSRRGMYYSGSTLKKDSKGQIDMGIGKGLALGNVTFSQDVIEINKKYSQINIDGIDMEFLLALDTEAPSEMFIYIPNEQSLCIAEDANATLHNLYTLRGAKVRDANAWAQSIQNALDLWGCCITTVFGVHNWPRFGNEASVNYLEKQRDIYQYIHDQTLRLINQGYTIDYVGRMVKLPKSLSKEWYNNGFYGTVNHNAKAVYQRYLGLYDGNPVDLNKLLPEYSAKKYIEYMGGENRVLEKAKNSFKNDEYQWVAEVTKQIIYANPENIEAKLLCADALEQLGYIAKSGQWRNEYLTGAQELRYGKVPPRASFISEDVLDNIPLKSVLNLLSIRLEGVKAGDFDYKINFIIPDRNESAATEVKRGIFRYLSNEISDDATVTVTMPKQILYELAATNNKPDESKIIIEGDIYKWYSFIALIDKIDTNFNIVTPVNSK